MSEERPEGEAQAGPAPAGTEALSPGAAPAPAGDAPAPAKRLLGSKSGRYDLGELVADRSGVQASRPERGDRADDTQHGLNLTWEDSDSHFKLRTRPSNRIAARRAARSSGGGAVQGTAARAAGAPPSTDAGRVDVDASDTFAAPLPEQLATASGSAFAAQPLELPAEPEPEAPARLVWLSWLLVLLVALPFATHALRAGSVTTPVPLSSLDGLGALRAREAWGEPWRLVQALTVHRNVAVLLVTCLLTLMASLEVERRRGAGTVLGLFVGLGALVNAARCVVETPGSLQELSGGWPAAVALGGAALALALLTPRGAGRGAARMGFALLLDVLLLALIAEQGKLLDSGLQATMLLAAGVGLVAGLLLSFVKLPPPGAPSPVGLGLGSAGLLLVLMAQLFHAAHDSQQPSSALPLPPGSGTELLPTTPEPDLPVLATRSLDELSASIDLPEEWEQLPSEAKGMASFRGTTRSFGARVSLRLQSTPKGPYDAPDTIARHVLATLGQPGGFLPGAEPVMDGVFEGACGRGFVIAVQGTSEAGQRYQYRIYLFVGARRTLRLDVYVDDEGDPAETARSAALLDKIARSVREKG